MQGVAVAAQRINHGLVTSHDPEWHEALERHQHCLQSRRRLGQCGAQRKGMLVHSRLVSE